MKVFLVGRVAAETDGAAIDETRFPGRQARRLFAYLVAEQGRAVPRDELAEALWEGRPPATWEKALTVLVSKVRALLAEHGIDAGSVLTAAFGCYRLELPEGSWVDVVAAANAAQEAEQALVSGELATATAAATVSVSLTQQTFLPGEEGAWVDQVRRELANVRCRALMTLADASLQAGDAAAAAAWVEQTIPLEPFREVGYRRLMEAHAAAGNRAEALRVYEQCRQLLADELGAYPSPETEAIYRRLLATPALPEPRQADAAPSEDVPVESSRTRAGPVAGLRPRSRRRIILTGLALVGVLTVAGVAVLVTRQSSSAVTAIASNSIAVIDTRHTTLVADIVLHTRPASIAYGAGALWAAAKDDQTLQEIDPRSHRIVRTIGLGIEPATIAASGRYVWVLGENTLLQFDADTGTRVRKLRLGGTIRVGPFKGRPLPPLAVETIPWADLAAGGGAAWVAYGSGVVARIDARTGTVDQINADSSFGIGFGDGAAWSISGEFVRAPLGTISRIDAKTRTVTEIPPSNVGAGPFISHGAIAAGPDGVWAIDAVNNRAFEIDPNVRRYTAAIPLHHPPHSVADGAGSAWLANDDATVSRIDSRAAAVIKTIPLGPYPRRAYPVDLTVGGGMVWVALH